MKYAITISREFGCGAREIGRKIAAQMGVKFYDKDLIDEAARKAGVHVDVIKESDEKAKKFFKEFSYGSSTTFYTEKQLMHRRKLLERLLIKSLVFYLVDVQIIS